VALNNIWRVRFGYEIGGIGGKPYEYLGTVDRIVEVIAPSVGGYPTLASIMAILAADGYGVPPTAPAGTVLAVRSLTQAPGTPTALGTAAAGVNGNPTWRVRWHYEAFGKILQQFGILAADFITPAVADGHIDPAALLTTIAANFATPPGAVIVVEGCSQSANAGNFN
jgi:hypothetical protein